MSGPLVFGIGRHIALDVVSCIAGRRADCAALRLETRIAL